MKILRFLIYLILLKISFQGLIIPDRQNPIQIFQPIRNLGGQSLDIRFKLPEFSSGLTFGQVFGVVFPKSRVPLDFNFQTTTKFTCSLKNSLKSFLVENVESIVSTVNNTVPVDTNVAFCKLLDSDNLIPSVTYVLTIKFANSISGLNYFYQIGLFTANDSNPEKIIFDYNSNIGSLAMFTNWETYTGPKALKMNSLSVIVTQGPSSLSGLSTLFPNNTFTVSIVINSDIYLNKEDFFIVVKYSNSRFTPPTSVSSIASLAGTSLTAALSGNMSVAAFELSTEISSTSESSFIINGVNENLIPNREFIFRFLGMTTTSNFLNTSSKFKLYVYSKNTYAALSYSEINAPLVQYNAITGLVHHPEWFKLIDGMSWPLKFTFSVNNLITGPTFVVIRQSNTTDVTSPKRFVLTASTCDFSEDSKIDSSFAVRPVCNTLKNDFTFNLGSATPYEGSGVIFLLNNGVQPNINYFVTIWGFAEVCGVSTDTTSTIDLSFRSYFEFSVKFYSKIDMSKKGDLKFIDNAYLIGVNTNPLTMAQECLHASGYGTNTVKVNNVKPTISGQLVVIETTDFWTTNVGTVIPNTFNNPPTSILEFFGSKYSFQTQNVLGLSYNNVNTPEKFIFSTNILDTVGGSNVLIGKFTRTDDTPGSHTLAEYIPTDCFYDTGATAWKNTPSRWEFIFSKLWFEAGNQFNTTGCIVSIVHEFDLDADTVCVNTDFNCFQRLVFNGNGAMDSGAAPVPYIKSVNPTSFADTIDIIRTHIPPVITSTTGENSIYRISSVKDSATGDVRNRFGVIESCTKVTNPNATNNVNIGYFETILFTNCLRWKATPPVITSIFAYFDVQWHNIRQLGASSLSTDPITRVWRYIKLYPQTGLIQNQNEIKHASPRRLVIGHYNATYWNKSNFGLCMIEINGQALSESYSALSNTLVIWLFSTSLLDIDLNNVAAEYPIAPVSSNIVAYSLNSGQVISSYNRLVNNNTTSASVSPNSFLERQWFGTIGNYFHATSHTAPFNPIHSMYQFYLGSAIYIRFKTTPSNLITSDTALQYPNLYIPFYCPQYGNTNSNLGTNGIAFSTPVVMINWVNATSFSKITSITKMLVDTTNNSMNKFANTPTNSVYNNATTYERSMIGLYNGTGLTNLDVENVISHPFANKPDSNLSYATLRFQPYTPTTLSNQQLFLYNGTREQTNSATLSCSGIGFLLHDSIGLIASKEVSVSGIGGITKLYGTQTNINFFFNGFPYNKIALGSVGMTYFPGNTPPTTTLPVATVIPNLGSTNLLSTSSVTFNGFIRPDIEKFTKDDTTKIGSERYSIDTSNKIGFFTVNNSFKKSPIASNFEIYLLTNFFYEDVETSTSLYHFLLDFNPTTTIWPFTEMKLDTESVYKDDYAGNVRVSFTTPTNIPAGTKINLVGNNSLLNLDSLCGIEENTKITECQISGVNVNCPVSTFTNQFKICCYNVRFYTDDVFFENGLVSTPHLPNISNANKFLSTSLYSVNIAVATPFIFKSFQSKATDPNFSISALITKLTYLQINQRSTVSVIEFDISLGRNPVRHMEIRINGDLSGFIVPNNFPRCRATFDFIENSDLTSEKVWGNNYNKGDVITSHCAVNNLASSTNPIVIRTKRMIYKCGINYERKLKIRLWPALLINWKVLPFNTLKFKVLTKLINTGIQLSATNTDFFMPFSDTGFLDAPPVADKWDILCPVKSIFPEIVGVYADYVFEIDLETHVSLLKNTNPNEVTIFLPKFMFNEYSELICYYLGKTVNCTFSYPSVLNIRVLSGFPLNKFQIKITGLRNPESLSNFSIPCTINETNFSSGLRKSIAVGSGLVTGLQSKATYNGSLIFLNQIVEPDNISPRYTSTHTFKIKPDFSNGISVDFDAGANVILSVIFPSQYNLSWYQFLEIKGKVHEFRINTTSTKNTVPILKREVAISKTEISGNKVDIYYEGSDVGLLLPTDYKNNTFLYMLIFIENVMNPIDNTNLMAEKTTEPYEIIMTNTKFTHILKTHNNVNNFTFSALNTPVDKYLTHYKGFQFIFPSYLWVIDVIDKIENALTGKSILNKIVVKPGRYNEYVFKTKTNTSQLIFINNTVITLVSNTFKLLENEYEMLTAYFEELPFMLGCPCNTAPGKYLIYFESSEKTLFAPLAPTEIIVDNLVKATISYIQPAPVRIAGSIFIYYSLSALNFDDMEVSWGDSTSFGNDGSAKIESKLIRAAANSNLYSIFSITSPFQGTLSYTSRNPTDCFIWVNNQVTITVKDAISIIPNNAITANNFVYYNSDMNPTPPILKNEIEFIFESTYSDIYLFCALICFNREVPSNEIIKNPDLVLPSIDSPLLRFNQQFLINNLPVKIKFSDLIRGQRYKLKCLIESAQGNSDSRTRSTILMEEAINTGVVNVDKKIIPVKSEASKCVEYTFDSDPGVTVKEALRNRCQKKFSEGIGFTENGCVICTDLLGKTVIGLEYPSNSTCSGNEYKFHPPRADTDPLLTLVGKFEKYTVCAAPHPNCINNVKDNKFTQLFDEFADEISTPADFRNKLNITGIRAFEKFKYSDSNTTNIDDLKANNIVFTGGIFRFNVTNPTPVSCYYRLTNATNPPSVDEIQFCRNPSCGYITVDKYNATGIADFGIFKQTTTFNLYAVCQTDVPFAQFLSDVKLIGSKLVDIKTVDDPRFNVTDPIDISKCEGLIFSFLLLILLLIVY